MQICSSPRLYCIIKGVYGDDDRENGLTRTYLSKSTLLSGKETAAMCSVFMVAVGQSDFFSCTLPTVET